MSPDHYPAKQANLINSPPKQLRFTWELFVLFLAVGSLIISCLSFSAKKYFWNDELYCYYFLSDPSFRHMWGSFNDLINQTPPVYFVVGWLWSQGFGASELSLRLFSSAGMGLACCLTWFTLRRTYSWMGTSLGVLVSFCGSSLVLYQNAEARMYGLYMAVCSLGLLVFDSLTRAKKPGIKLLLANFLAQAALIQTHLHGLFFSGAMLLALLLADRYVHRFRPWVYLSSILGWLTFLLYLPSFLIQTQAGTPRSYLFVPNARDLLEVLSLREMAFASLPVTVSSLKGVTVLISLVLMSAWYFGRTLPKGRISSPEIRQSVDSKAALLLFAYTLLATVLLIWLISQFIRPIFMGRYLLPVTLIWSILIAHAVTQFNQRSGSLLPLSRPQWGLRLVGYAGMAALAGYLLINPIWYAHYQPAEEPPGHQDGKYGYADLPLVVNLYSGEFLKRLHYSPQRARYRFILDWSSAVDPTSGLFPPQEYKHLEALNRRYPIYFNQQVVQSQNFLTTSKRFLVLTYSDYTKTCTLEPIPENFQCPRWFAQVILTNSAFRVTTLGQVYANQTLHLVETR